MFASIFVGISLISNLLFATPSAQTNTHVLGSREFSLEKRYSNKWVSDIFKDNILLNLAYLRGIVRGSDIDWNQVEKPFHYQFTLKNGEVFAFHDDVLPEFEGKIAKTTGAHFNSYEGFKSDGWLVGDGVCHLASIIYWAAKDAGLDAIAPTNHNFMPIPEIPKEYGVAIYDVPGQSSSNQAQNLYIKNNKGKNIDIAFNYDGEKLRVSVEESK